MKLKIFFLPIAITLLLNACKQDNAGKQGTEYQDCKLDVQNMLKIPSEKNWRGGYKISQYVKIDGEDYLIGYNYSGNRIEFKNLNRKTNDHFFSLTKEGPNSIPEVVSIYFHNKDSLFILSFFSLALTDWEGNINWIEKINREGSRIKNLKETDIIWCDINHGSPIYFNKKEGCIYFAFKPLSYMDESRFKQNLCGRLFLSDFRVEKFPIFLPDKFSKKYYGHFESINFLFSDDKIVYCFNHDPTIYSFNMNKIKTRIYEYHLKYTKKFAPPMSGSIDRQSQDAMRYVNENPLFFQLFFDGQYYYRCNMGEIDTGIGKRNKFITILDSEFIKVLESPLPKEALILSSNIPTPNGLMMEKNVDTEAYVEYLFVKPNCISL
jgi:hypothetical protein